MNATSVAARVSGLAARQWGLLTTAQAQVVGVTRLQLARLADKGVIERVDQGIYATPAAVDERTPLRTAWLSLEPMTMAEERLNDPVPSGVVSHTSAAALHEVGDLLDAMPEITVLTRRQSRRYVRLHYLPLSADEVTIVDGLPVTTAERTVADLLRDRHDPSHVAEIAGEVLQRGLASRGDLAAALDPLARRNDHQTGAALLEHLLDLVGLSSAALVQNLAASELGQAFIKAGQLSALRMIIEVVAKADLPEDAQPDVGPKWADLVKTLEERLPEGVLPKVDMAAVVSALEHPVAVDRVTFERALRESVPLWLSEVIRSVPTDAWPATQLGIEGKSPGKAVT